MVLDDPSKMSPKFYNRFNNNCIIDDEDPLMIDLWLEKYYILLKL